MKKIVKKEKTKGRSEEGRGSKDKIKKEIVKDIKKVGKGMALAASFLPAGRAVKAVKAASNVKRLNPSKKTFGQINKEIFAKKATGPKDEKGLTKMKKALNKKSK